jgi:UDP-glucose 4-epimerase
MDILVTGAAGFIGSHLCEFLIEKGHRVRGMDNFSKGNLNNLHNVSTSPEFSFIEGDVCDLELTERASHGCDAVFHFADESDIQHALEHPDSYFVNNVGGLYSVLNAVERNEIKKIVFPSSTTVFGRFALPPISESYGPLLPESLYGASKVSSEAFLHAWAHAHNVDTLIFRFAAIIGGRQDHGVVHDFVRGLSENSNRLNVLGNGTQTRSFVLVDDCVRIICDYFFTNFKGGYEVVHLANPDVISISEVAHIVCLQLGLGTEIISFQNNELGWLGDSKTNQLDIPTLTSVGLLPLATSREAVIEATKRLAKQYGFSK